MLLSRPAVSNAGFMLAKKTKIRQTFFALILALAVSFFPLLALASPINADVLLQLVNAERVKQGLPALKPDFKLGQAAYKKAKDILSKGYFAHTNPDGKRFYEWIEDEDYDYLYAGENLAIDFTENEPAVSAWLESALHRENVLNKNYTDTGLAALQGNWQSRETFAVVQLFGSPYAAAREARSLTPAILGELNIKKGDLAKIASGLIVLPSMAGERYFDIAGKAGQKLNFRENGLAFTPFLNNDEGLSFNILLAAFALLLILSTYSRELRSLYGRKYSA